MSRVPRHLHKDFFHQIRRGEEEDDEESDTSSDDGSLVDKFPEHKPRSVEPAARAKIKKHTNEDGEEWAKSQQKVDIIAAFLDKNSGIHTMTTTQIYEAYAAGHGWIKKNAIANIGRLQKQYRDRKGPFSENEVNEVEPFKTRKSKSKAYSLLLKMYMNQEQSGIRNMSVEQLHKSEASFRLYPLNDFKKYNADVKKMAEKKKAKLKQDTAVFERHMKAHPRREMTAAGQKFWDTHVASEVLEEDFDRIEKGLLPPTKPKAMWESRSSYKEFPLDVFRNHYFQELRKRKESNFWRHKMKLVARKEHIAEVEKMYDNWLWADINGDELVKTWNQNLVINTREENEKANADFRRVHAGKRAFN